jgi:hypothetical protein
MSRVTTFAYRVKVVPGHPYPKNKRLNHVYEHRLVAEKSLGKYLHPIHPVHHVNGDGTDNRPQNLVICESHAYHRLLHRRAKAFAACGDPSWRPCDICGTHDSLENLTEIPDKARNSERYQHVMCRRKRANRYYAAKKARS